ncbi:SDR family NAD(P)-dependent oxidoreductase [Panacagrimonas sp.]|uniref:SDR family NAD(P)-dependent oxidoreductase n=1 Tax=Panacagrimonas sp. TaxID=2480088 RepID=UPI003B515E27
MSTYPQTLFDLSGRKALVTGASGGLGEHFAHTLARAGAEVVLAARRADKLEATVQAIRAAGGKACAVAMDVVDRASVIDALDRANEQVGTLDILVNNAGVSGTKRALDYTDEDWDWVVNTNLKGAWIVAQETARRLIQAKQPGSLINITSILASRVTGLLSPYAAAKSGLQQLTRALALEFARYDIRVNSIAPGYFITEINREHLSGAEGEKFKQRIPTRRFGEYADLEGPLLLLASPAGRHMTGSEIVVDGGHLVSAL